MIVLSLLEKGDYGQKNSKMFFWEIVQYCKPHAWKLWYTILFIIALIFKSYK